MELFVDNSAASQTAQLVARFANIQNLKITQVTDELKKSDSFKKVSSNGDVPALSGPKGNASNLVSIASQLHPNLVGSSEKELDKELKFILKEFAPMLTEKDGSRATGKLHKINKDLAPVVFILGGNAPTVADLALYNLLHPLVSKWSVSECVSFANISRWFDFLQHYPGVNGFLSTVSIKKDVSEEARQAKPQAKEGEKKEAQKKDEQKKDAKKEDSKKDAKKEDTKKEDKKEDKPQQKKEAKGAAPKEAETVDVSRLDIRVGKILNCKVHDGADTLYVEEIDVGEGKPRQVVSGLRKFIPIDQMQNRMVVVLCNLKPAKMKGIESQAMVLAASNTDHTVVELVDPPASSKVGEHVTFDGYPGTPDEQLNPKKKVWETVQPDLGTTGDDKPVAVWKGVPFKTSAGICTVKSLKNAHIK